MDEVKNTQDEALIDFLKDTGLVIVNGRKGKDAFTCVSSRGRSVVDYCVAPTDCMEAIDNFRVVTMRECIEEMRVRREPKRIPDHSCLMWEIKDAVNENLQSEENGSEDREVPRLRYEIPENYLMEEMDNIDHLSKRLQGVHISQEEMDYIYQDIVDMMKRNLKEVVQRRGAEKRQGQVWFHKRVTEIEESIQ